MKINFKTYQAALKDLRHFKQQADVFSMILHIFYLFYIHTNNFYKNLIDYRRLLRQICLVSSKPSGQAAGF